MQDTTILKRNGWRLYYYQGNFYYPLFGLSREDKNLIKLHIKWFKRDFAERVKMDRANPDYKTKVQLFEESQTENL